MAEPYLAPSLERLLAEVNKLWPNRSKASDGWLGDRAHSYRESDHNPNDHGSVNALDVTADGISPYTLVKAAIKHPSTNYVIHNRKIWSSSRDFQPVDYAGSNPHTTHVHVSIHQTYDAENNTQRWFFSSFPLPEGHSFGQNASASVHDGTKNTADRVNVMRIQKRLGISATGRYGAYTAARVLAWQIWKFKKGNGRVGETTWRAMGL